MSKLCKKKRIHLFNSIVFGVAFIVLLLLNVGKSYDISLYTVGIAFLYATLTLGAQLFTIKAVQLGDVSVTSLIYYCGFIIPTIFSSIIWKESFNAFKILGLVLIIISFVFSVEKKGKKGNWAWLITALLAMLCSGCIGIVQKVFSKSEYGCELRPMLCLAFAILTIVCLFLFFITKRKVDADDGETETDKKSGWKKETFAAIGMGFSTAIPNVINTYLSGIIPGIIFFPVVNGGAILLAMLGGRLFFKEKLTKRKMFAIFIGLLAIVFLVL